MARDKLIQVRTGTRAQLEAAKTAGTLAAGEPYLITDESRLAVGTAADEYAAMMKVGEASGSASLLALAYDDRADLRTNETDAWAVIDGLGLFQYVAGSDEPDDDESCFAAENGRWLLQCVHWDLVDAWQLPDDEVRDDRDDAAETRLDSAETRWPGRVLFGTADQTITSIAAVTQTSFTATITGSTPNDHVIVTPPTDLGGRISVFARVTAADTVTIYLNNPSAASQSLSTGTWRVAVIQEN